VGWGKPGRWDGGDATGEKRHRTNSSCITYDGTFHLLRPFLKKLNGFREREIRLKSGGKKHKKVNQHTTDCDGGKNRDKFSTGGGVSA